MNEQMQFFRITSDACWVTSNDSYAEAQFSPDVECVMPDIDCPICGSAQGSTKTPGFCYPAMNVDRFPSAVRRSMKPGIKLVPTDWINLKNRVLEHLPYEVYLSAGALFGRGTIEIEGKWADCYPKIILGKGRF